MILDLGIDTTTIMGEAMYKAAFAWSELCEPSGAADSQFVWFTTRSFYKSDIPTGDPSDALGYEEHRTDASSS